MEKLVKDEAAAEAWEHEDFEYEISPLTLAYVAKTRLQEMRRERLAAISPCARARRPPVVEARSVVAGWLEPR